MEIQVTELESCKLQVQYQADPEQILNKRAEVLNIFKKAPVKGFREGKTPLDAIKFQYKDQIEDALKRALAEDAFHNTLFEKKIKPHGAPKFNSLNLANGKFTCEFEVYTKPDFDLAPFDNLEIPQPHASTSDIELSEKLLQELRVRFGEILPFSETDHVQTGDNVIISYESFIDGEKHPNLCAEGEMFTVGANSPSVIDTNILGMHAGETREFDFLVPEAALPSLSGKVIHMKLTVNTGSKTTPHPIDDALAAKVGRKDVNELREFVRGSATAKINLEQNKLKNEAVALKLVNDNQINVPNWMTLSEAKYLAHNAKLEWESMHDEDKVKYMEMAERNVKLSLILDKVRECSPEAQLSDQEVFDIIKQNLSNTKLDTPLDQVIEEMNRTGYLQILFARLKEEYALDYVLKQVKFIE